MNKAYQKLPIEILVTLLCRDCEMQMCAISLPSLREWRPCEFCIYEIEKRIIENEKTKS